MRIDKRIINGVSTRQLQADCPLDLWLPVYGRDRTISFSNNWNNKLTCNSFSTIRLIAQWHKPGIIVNVNFQDMFAFRCTIMTVARIKASQLSNAACYLDTGYNKEETINILLKMYRHKDPDSLMLDYMTLKRIPGLTWSDQP